MIAKFNSHTHVTNKLEMLLREIAFKEISRDADATTLK
jgi:hypothetical protein